VFIASYEFVNLVDVKSADPSAQFLLAAAPPSPATPVREIDVLLIQ
jgi:hypothetical protein